MILNPRRRIQTGRGVGSILKGIKRQLKPILKSPRVRQIAKNVAKQAAKSSVALGSNVLNDVMQGENIVDSFKRNFPEHGTDLVQKAMEEVKSSRPKKRRGNKTSGKGEGVKKSKKEPVKRKKKRARKRADIFE